MNVPKFLVVSLYFFLFLMSLLLLLIGRCMQIFTLEKTSSGYLSLNSFFVASVTHSDI